MENKNDFEQKKSKKTKSEIKATIIEWSVYIIVVVLALLFALSTGEKEKPDPLPYYPGKGGNHGFGKPTAEDRARTRAIEEERGIVRNEVYIPSSDCIITFNIPE